METPTNFVKHSGHSLMDVVHQLVPAQLDVLKLETGPEPGGRNQKERAPPSGWQQYNF